MRMIDVAQTPVAHGERQPSRIDTNVAHVANEAPGSAGWWIVRGAMVGSALGGSAGSIYPILGTAIGFAGGFAAGTVIGAAMMLIAAVTRELLPANPKLVQLREQFFCLAVIWGLAFILARTAGSLVAIPATIGSIHALAAGTPTRQSIYAGPVSKFRRYICKGLPIGMLVVIAVGWTVALAMSLANN
jgi:hypothetical protein